MLMESRLEWSRFASLSAFSLEIANISVFTLLLVTVGKRKYRSILAVILFKLQAPHVLEGLLLFVLN